MYTISTYRDFDGNAITFEAHTTLESTAAKAREYAARGYSDRYVVYTEMLSRIKSSKKVAEADTQRGLFMTCILRPSIFASQASPLGAMATLAAVTALEEHTDSRLGIGWVTDVYCEGTKIGKVTIEGQRDDFQTFHYILVTFEFKITKEHFPDKLDDMVRAVFAPDDNTTVKKLMAKNILSKFFKLYSSIKTPEKFMDSYYERFALRGKKVKYRISENKWKHFKVIEIDKASGSLRIEDHDKLSKNDRTSNTDNDRGTAKKQQKRHGYLVKSPALIQNPRRYRLK